jgi:hypothetical protein
MTWYPIARSCSMARCLAFSGLRRVEKWGPGSSKRAPVVAMCQIVIRMMLDDDDDGDDSLDGGSS